jgi:hypothetical protein
MRLPAAASISPHSRHERRKISSSTNLPPSSILIYWPRLICRAAQTREGFSLRRLPLQRQASTLGAGLFQTASHPQSAAPYNARGETRKVLVLTASPRHCRHLVRTDAGVAFAFDFWPVPAMKMVPATQSHLQAPYARTRFHQQDIPNPPNLMVGGCCSKFIWDRFPLECQPKFLLARAEAAANLPGQQATARPDHPYLVGCCDFHLHQQACQPLVSNA